MHTVKKARKNYPKNGIGKGDSYYWWKFRFGPVIRSKTFPKRQQLTRSSFLLSLYNLEDDTVFDRHDLEGSRDSFVPEIEQLKEECESSLENMPEQLQESSPAAETLRERIDGLESWVDDLEGVDCEIDEDLKGDEREERIQEIIDELESCSSGL